MKCKTKTIYLFMTESDSVYFLNYLLGRDSVCINATPSLSKDIEVVDRIPVSTKNSNKLYAIINTSIVSLNKYIKNSELISGYYHYPQIGEGIIQFLPCYLSNYNEKCIMYGQLSFSYSDKDSEEWIKNIFTWIKKMGRKYTEHLSQEIFHLINPKKTHIHYLMLQKHIMDPTGGI